MSIWLPMTRWMIELINVNCFLVVAFLRIFIIQPQTFLLIHNNHYASLMKMYHNFRWLGYFCCYKIQDLRAEEKNAYFILSVMSSLFSLDLMLWFESQTTPWGCLLFMCISLVWTVLSIDFKMNFVLCLWKEH